jgi:hypothetical protein
LEFLRALERLEVQGWIGDLSVRIEHEFFGDDAFTEVVKGQRRRSIRNSQGTSVYFGAGVLGTVI